MARIRQAGSNRSKTKPHPRRENPALFKGVPKNISPLRRAYLLTEKAAQVGFDWPTTEGILNKLDEEMGELREALSLRNRRRIREEIGDLLFVLVNLSRFLRIPPEEALGDTLEKFTSRFRYIESKLQKEGKSFQQSNLLEMDRWWEESKKRERGG